VKTVLVMIPEDHKLCVSETTISAVRKALGNERLRISDLSIRTGKCKATVRLALEELISRGQVKAHVDIRDTRRVIYWRI
jgi:hypothetical protein